MGISNYFKFQIVYLHEMFASENISTAGGGDEDVAPVNAILDGGHLKGFKMFKQMSFPGATCAAIMH